MYSLNTEHKTYNQSPKIRANKQRPGTSMGFSLIDINEKIVNFKGVNVPKTYERKEYTKLYNEYIPNISTYSSKRPETSSIVKNDRRLSNDNRMKVNTQYFKTFQNEYDKLLKEAHVDFKDKILLKSIIKEKAERTNFSDNHFITHELAEVKNSKNNLFLKSDIFNKNDEISKLKSSEKYIFNKNHNAHRVFTTSSKSNSEWVAMKAEPSLLNHTSTAFHPLNPGIKNISRTKDEIMKTTIDFNPIHRQKMLCEYTDITRVSGPKPLKDFRKVYKNNNFAFNRTSDLCTTYLDNFKNYKNLIGEPFKK